MHLFVGLRVYLFCLITFNIFVDLVFRATAESLFVLKGWLGLKRFVYFITINLSIRTQSNNFLDHFNILGSWHFFIINNLAISSN